MTPSPPAHKNESPVEDQSHVKQPLEKPPTLTIGSSSGSNILHSLVTPPPAIMYSLPESECIMNLAQKILQPSLSL